MKKTKISIICIVTLGIMMFFDNMLAVSLYVVKYLRTKLDESQKRIDKESKAGDDDSNTNNHNTKKQMVKCEKCGLYIPEKEAFKQGDRTFCSLEHIKQDL